MAHTKATGTTKLGRDSEAKRLGVKLHNGQRVYTGNIIVRQRGSRYIPGLGTRIGGDDTIYAIKDGAVKFTKRRKFGYDGRKHQSNVVAVVPMQTS